MIHPIWVPILFNMLKEEIYLSEILLIPTLKTTQIVPSLNISL